MITATIVIASLALALVYTGVWLFVPRAREQIEQPKHWFMDQIEQYDRACHGVGISKDEPDDN